MEIVFFRKSSLMSDKRPKTKHKPLSRSVWNRSTHELVTPYMTDIKKQRNLLVEVFKTKMSHTKSATTEKK